MLLTLNKTWFRLGGCLGVQTLVAKRRKEKELSTDRSAGVLKQLVGGCGATERIFLLSVLVA